MGAQSREAFAAALAPPTPRFTQGPHFLPHPVQDFYGSVVRMYNIAASTVETIAGTFKTYDNLDGTGTNAVTGVEGTAKFYWMQGMKLSADAATLYLAVRGAVPCGRCWHA